MRPEATRTEAGNDPGAGAAVAGAMLAADLDPSKAGEDLARVVLALVEFVRRLLELQAIRRMEAGALSGEEEEQVGRALMQAGNAIRAVADRFGLSESDLNLDLGPLGRLL